MTHHETQLAHLQRFGIRPGLERAQAILQRLGNPQNDFPIALVGGTNGKGSTSEFLARRLAQTRYSQNLDESDHNGARVGLFTSPHLYRWNERIRVLDSAILKSNAAFPGAISDEEFDQLFEILQPHLEGVASDENLGNSTEFETLTCLGLLYFARRRVDIAVVEVGLGGRFDATNITQPLVSVVTHVALDHCDRLGNTHVEIASDKVEIARPNRVFVTAETRDDVLQVFRAHCDKIGAKLWSLQRIEYSNDRENLEMTLQKLARETAEKGETDAPEFQVLNAKTAGVAHFALAQSDERFAFEDDENARKIVASTIPGRFQIVGENPTIILDGANNPDGAAQLAGQLHRVLETRPNAKLTLVLGILSDKDFRAMIAELAPLAHKIIATQSNSPRACSAEEVAEEARRFCADVETVVPAQAAFERAKESSTRNDIVCVTGSFYTIGEIEIAPENP